MKMTDAQLYDVFARRDTAYEAMFFMGVKSTGIFCRPGCPARLPKRENCTFHQTTEEALSAGYRACKRCHPMKLPGEASSLVKALINLVEDDPERKWSEVDLRKQGIDPSTARRQFKARFGMTFTDYARRRRMARATTAIHKGEKVIEAQLSAGYDSPSGFRTAFSKTFGCAPKGCTAEPLMIEWIDTKLGPMMAICDNEYLYLLEFTIRKNIQRQFERIAKVHRRAIVPGRTPITDQIEQELGAYFGGALQSFKTPLALTGTDFQKSVWQALCDIPFGTTQSYSDLAESVGNEKAVRAVASSNANNGLALIVPCHRVIAKGGGLGGYAGGLDKKTWLIAHEKRYSETD